MNRAQTRGPLGMAYSLLRGVVSTTQIHFSVGSPGKRREEVPRVWSQRHGRPVEPADPPPEPNPTSVAEIGSLARAVEAERAGRYVEAWTEALKAISLRPFHPEAYIQITSVLDHL